MTCGTGGLTMAEYIERESLVEDIKQYSHARIDNDVIDQMGFQFVEEIVSILRIIEKQPTADVVEVKHGEWIYNVKYYSCSICAGKRFNLLLGTDAEYCPYCGAKMDLKEGAD